MLSGKTTTGFEFEIDEKRADDMELLEALALADTNRAHFPKVLSMLLGDEQKAKLYEHCRTEKGNVPIQKTIEEFLEIMSISGEKLKNS